MTLRKKNLIIFGIFFALLLVPNFVFAGKDYGQPCKENSECNSGGCEESPTSKGGDGKYYCDCGDSFFDSTDDNYCAKLFSSGKRIGETWRCVNGSVYSNGLDYCSSNVRGVISPQNYVEYGPSKYADPNYVGATDPNSLLGNPAAGASLLKDITNTKPLTTNDIQTFLQKPAPRIAIPGVSFSNIKIEGLKNDSADGSVYLNIPFIGEYIAAIYKYAVVATSALALVMIIVAGFQWIIPDGSSENIEAAKKRIEHAVIGMVLALGSYVILYTINPNLVQFKSLRVQFIAGAPLDIEEDDNDNSSPGNPAKIKPGTTVLKDSIQGEQKIGRCHVISESQFPTFNLDDFSDGGVGQCLLEEYFPNVGSNGLSGIKSEMVHTTFLGQSIWVHKKAADALKGVESDIKAKNSAVVKYWVDNFHTDGAWVDSTSMKSITQKCNSSGPESWIVVKGDKNGLYASRLGNRVLQNLYGNHTNVIRGDLHAFGVAIDVFASYNPDYKNGDGKITRPMVTQVPAEVAEAFYNHGYQWLGAAAGRDAMHFQYYGGSCFGGQGNKFPSGNGCCMNSWTKSAKPTYSQCLAKGGVAKTYQECLGPTGQAESMWIKETVDPK